MFLPFFVFHRCFTFLSADCVYSSFSFLPLWCAAYAYSLPYGHSCFFLSLGSYLAICQPFSLEGELRGKRILLVIWLCLAVLIGCLSNYAGMSPVQIWSPLFWLFGIIALWYNYDLIRGLFENKFGLWFTQWTFFIYAAHYPFIVIIRKCVVYFFGFHLSVQTAGFFIIPIVVIGINIAVAVILKKFFTPIYLVLTGHRYSLRLPTKEPIHSFREGIKAPPALPVFRASEMHYAMGRQKSR